jgi:hypothetical protein
LLADVDVGGDEWPHRLDVGLLSPPGGPVVTTTVNVELDLEL